MYYFLPFVADVLSGSTSSSVHHSGVLEEWAGGQTWWNSRITVMLITTIFILAPLASFRHIGNCFKEQMNFSSPFQSLYTAHP